MKTSLNEMSVHIELFHFCVEGSKDVLIMPRPTATTATLSPSSLLETLMAV